MKNLRDALLSLSMLLFTTPLIAEGNDTSSAPPDQGFWQTLVMIGIALLFFYFILWRPEQKRRQAAEQQRNSMKKGDRVTAMGIIGTVSRITDNTVILTMVDGAKIEFLKGAISDVAPASEEEAKKGE